MSGLPPQVLRWRDLARRYAGSVPSGFILTVIAHESAGNPRAESNTGARGLMQITGVALRAVNHVLGTAYSKDDMFDPATNIRVGATLLNGIVVSWQRHHKATLWPRWKDPKWVALLVWAWNAGSFESNGVGYVVGQMEKRGLRARDITPDTAFREAEKLPRASRWLKIPGRIAWAKKVARTYVSLYGRSGGKEAKAPSRGISTRWKAILIGGAVAGGAYLWLRSKGESKARSRQLKISPEQRALLRGATI